MLNLSEKHKQAISGDFRAMLDLADYYYDRYRGGDNNSLQVSIMWLDRAADAGSMAGVMLSQYGSSNIQKTRRDYCQFLSTFMQEGLLENNITLSDLTPSPM